MEQTYKNLRKLAVLYEPRRNEHDDENEGDHEYANAQRVSIEAVALQYQNNEEDPICFAYVFCKLYPFMLSRLDRYYYLTTEDKASFCLEELNKAMRNYDFYRGNKVLTIFNTYLIRRLTAESRSLGFDKRRVNNATSNYEEQLSAHTYKESYYEQIELLESLSKADLRENELSYCKMLIKYSGKIRDVDIAKRLNISTTAISHIKDSLANKLNARLLI